MGDTLTDAQKEYLSSIQESVSGNCYAIGGKGAVSEEAFEEVKAYATGTSERVFGKTRFATSVAIAKKFFPNNINCVVLAYAMNYPDGLAGGPVAYSLSSPLLLITNDDYAAAKEYVGTTTAKKVKVMGGAKLISDETALALVE